MNKRNIILLLIIIVMIGILMFVGYSFYSYYKYKGGSSEAPNDTSIGKEVEGTSETETPKSDTQQQPNKTGSSTSNTGSGSPGSGTGDSGGDEEVCTPDCSFKECGDDGCGGDCGECEEGYCDSGICKEGNVYYVDAVNGNDSWSGTSLRPWKTLNRTYTWYSGNETKVQEGDTILFRNGSYSEFRESTGTNPGEKYLFYRNNWITYKADEGHEPVIDNIYINNEDKWPEWHTPNTYVSSGWDNPDQAYDNDHFTFAEELTKGEWIEFQLNKTIYLKYVRINASLGDSSQPNITVEAWDGDWVQVYTGNFSAKQWEDISVSKNTDKIRVKSVDSSPEKLRIYEIKFGEIDHGKSSLIFDGFRIPNGINIRIANYINIRNCNVTNNNVMPYEGFYAPYFYANYNVIQVTSSAHITIENNDIWRNHRGLDISGGGYNIIRNNTIHHVGEDVMNANSDNTIVENNILYDINKRRTSLWVFQGDMIGVFEVNETILQKNTGAEGLVVRILSSTKLDVINTNDKDFDDGENVTGLSSGALLHNVYVDYAHTDDIQIHSKAYNLTIKGNMLLRPEGGNGLKMVRPGDVKIYNNLIYTTRPLYWSGTERGITLINNTLVLPLGFPSSSGSPAVGYEGLESNIMHNMSNNIIYAWEMAADNDDLGVYTKVIDHKSNIFGNDPNGAGGPTYPFYVDYKTELVNYDINSLFVDPVNMDYRVIMSSPACDGSVNEKPETAVGAFECVCRDDTDCIFGGNCVDWKCVGVKNCFGTNKSCGVFPNCKNCEWKDGCYGNEYRDYFCSGTSCNFNTYDCTDCGCSCGGYGEPESIEKGNCGDSKDNDCDGNIDNSDYGCQEPTGIPNDYIAYYRFEGTIDDYTGNHTGTWLGKNIEVYSERVTDNYALGFDGLDDYVELVNHEDFNMTNEFTISAWVKPLGSGTDTIFTKGAVDSGGMYQHYNLWVKGNGPFQFKVELSNYSNSDELTSPNFEKAKWYYVTARFNGTTGSIFVNGTEVVSKTTAFNTLKPATASYDRVRIGGEQCSNGQATDFFNGTIDELIVYKRALTDAEIQQIYDSQKSLEVSSLSPFAKLWNWLKSLLTLRTSNVITGNFINGNVVRNVTE